MNVSRRSLFKGMAAASALPLFNLGRAGAGEGRARQITKGAKLRIALIGCGLQARQIINAVRGAAEAKVKARVRLPVVPKLGAEVVVPAKKPAVIRETTHKVVVVGASTGGTEALREFLEVMPPDA